MSLIKIVLKKKPLVYITKKHYFHRAGLITGGSGYLLFVLSLLFSNAAAKQPTKTNKEELHNTAKNSPHLEVLRKKGYEVLLLSDRIDEWMMSSLREFDGKSFQDVTKGKLDIEVEESEEQKKEKEQKAEQIKPLLDRMKSVLEEKVTSVNSTDRLTNSPACLVVGEFDMGLQMRRLLEQAGQQLPESKPSLEVNPDHPIVQKMDAESDEDRFADMAWLLYEQATLAEGGQLDDPATFVSRMNKLIVQMSN